MSSFSLLSPPYGKLEWAFLLLFFPFWEARMGSFSSLSSPFWEARMGLFFSFLAQQ